MGFQSSFNQALGTIAGAALGAKHIKGQKESLAEQKMQGKFNVEREVDREQEQNEVAETNANIDKNEMMAERAGQALASETNSRNYTHHATIPAIRREWIQQYMDWYGVNKKEAVVAFKKQNIIHGDMIYPRKPVEKGGNE